MKISATMKQRTFKQLYSTHTFGTTLKLVAKATIHKGYDFLDKVKEV